MWAWSFRKWSELEIYIDGLWIITGGLLKQQITKGNSENRYKQKS